MSNFETNTRSTFGVQDEVQEDRRPLRGSSLLASLLGTEDRSGSERREIGGRDVAMPMPATGLHTPRDLDQREDDGAAADATHDVAADAGLPATSGSVALVAEEDDAEAYGLFSEETGQEADRTREVLVESIDRFFNQFRSLRHYTARLRDRHEELRHVHADTVEHLHQQEDHLRATEAHRDELQATLDARDESIVGLEGDLTQLREELEAERLARAASDQEVERMRAGLASLMDTKK